MPSRNRGRGDPPANTDALLSAADTFAAQPAEEVMDDLGLTREKAEHWQRICAELAQAVRIEHGLANSRPRGFRFRGNATSRESREKQNREVQNRDDHGPTPARRR